MSNNSNIYLSYIRLNNFMYFKSFIKSVMSILIIAKSIIILINNENFLVNLNSNFTLYQSIIKYNQNK